MIRQKQHDPHLVILFLFLAIVGWGAFLGMALRNRYLESCHEAIIILDPNTDVAVVVPDQQVCATGWRLEGVPQ